MASTSVVPSSEGGVASGSRNKEVFKVLVVGDFSVGKTSLIRRTVENLFTEDYKITIGVDFFIKKIQRQDKYIDLQLWDIAGHEKFGTSVKAYYRFAMAVFVVFDMTRKATLEKVLEWRNSINDNVTLKSQKPLPMILLANKCDLTDSISTTDEEIEEFVQREGFLAWFKTSAKENVNVERAMARIADEILSIDRSEYVTSNSANVLDGMQKRMYGGGGALSGNQYEDVPEKTESKPKRKGCC